MFTRRRVGAALAVSLALVQISACRKPEYEAGVSISSIEFGEYDGNLKLTPTRKIKYSIGKKYGWDLEVSSTSGKVRVREVFKLPGSAKWPDEDTPDDVANVRQLRRTLSADKSEQMLEWELNCGDKQLNWGQVYEIVDGDPKGTYLMIISIDGQERDHFEFVVE